MLAVKKTFLELNSDQENSELLKKFRVFLETAPDPMLIINQFGKIELINVSLEKMFGYSADELIGKDLEVLVPDRFKKVHKENTSRFFANPVDRPLMSGLDLFGQKKNGSEFPVEISLKPIVLNNIMYVSSAIRDISERKRILGQLESSIKEKDLLLREVHHRVKNNLQIITSLLRLQSVKTKDESSKQYLLDSQNRILILAMLHEQLYKSKAISHIALKDYVGALTRNLFLSFGMSSQDIKLTVDADNFQLDPDKLIPLGLIINELVSNSIKYAFEKPIGGHIEVLIKSHTDNQFKLTVKDNGKGLPADFNLSNPQSLGLMLVKSLVKQLDGELSFNTKNGAHFEIVFPYMVGAHVNERKV